MVTAGQGSSHTISDGSGTSVPSPIVSTMPVAKETDWFVNGILIPIALAVPVKTPDNSRSKSPFSDGAVPVIWMVA